MHPDVQPKIREVVIVDPACESYSDFVDAARSGDFGLHFCVDGRSALRLARRFRADAWLLAVDLPDMSGFDLLSSLAVHVLQGGVDPLRSGSRISLGRPRDTIRSGIFMVADAYRVDQERQALASGVSGYLVRPVTLDLFRSHTSSVGWGSAERAVGDDCLGGLPLAGAESSAQLVFEKE
jgi:CheY-like chemotaxis protein